MELVGVKCYADKKEGVDAARLGSVSTGETGVKATRNSDTLLRLPADCVIFAPFDPLTDPTIPGSPSSAWVPDLLAILRSGKNVIATILSISHWRHLAHGEAFRDSVNSACREGKSTLFVTGLDPGFASDAIAFGLSSIVGEITQINTWEILDYGSYPGIPALKALGFGARPQDLSGAGLDTIRVAWGGCPHVLADAFGVTLDGIRVEAEVSLAKETFAAVCGLVVNEGTIEALKFKVIGTVSGRDCFIVNHITRVGQAAAPHWRKIGQDGGYGIEIDGFPPFKGEFPFGWPGGTGASWSDAMAMTAARCVNSIEPVVQASPGYKTFMDLAPLGGRYALRVTGGIE